MRDITPADLSAWLADTARLSPRVLDVREPWELALAALPANAQALPIPMGDVLARLAELDPGQPIVCVCHHGVRSRRVAGLLLSRGFESVYNLSGGIERWALDTDRTIPRY